MTGLRLSSHELTGLWLNGRHDVVVVVVVVYVEIGVYVEVGERRDVDIGTVVAPGIVSGMCLMFATRCNQT